MKIYHTSPSVITNINSYGTFGECLCFSDNVYQMSACDVIVYSLDIDSDDIIEASSFLYHEDYIKLDSIIQNIMDLADCDRETAEDCLSQKDNHEDAEIDWRIQGYAGEAAKVLGYLAASAQDEQGTVYLVPMLRREGDLNA